MPQESIHIGIDFGTTNTAVCYILSTERGAVTNKLGDKTNLPFSSHIAIPKNGGDWLFGRDVKNKREELSQDYYIISSIKSMLDENKSVSVGGICYSAVEITAQFLSYIREYIKENHLIEFSEATLAFPIDFKPAGRTALREAAKRAGIAVKGFVYESTAAYIANLEQVKACSKVMIIDWGGGTADVSILELNGNELHELTVNGARIGGDDIDLLIAERVHAKFALQNNIKTSFAKMDLSSKDRMLAQAETVKCSFSIEDEATVELITYGEFMNLVGTISYNDFIEIITPILNDVLQLIETAMQQVNVAPAGIDAVVLAGGSSELRAFYALIAEVFGENKILAAQKKQWSVASGAALINMSGGEYYLNDDVCLQLSDDTLYPLLEKGVAKIGYKINTLTFALTEDSPNAYFIFKNGNGRLNYGIKSIATKGFLKETLLLDATIGQDQIATITISNATMGKNYSEQYSIGQLKFYYDLSAINL